MHRYKTIFILLWAGISFLVSLASLEAQEAKIVYIDISKAFSEYERTKEADKSLEKKGREKERQRDKMVNEIKKLREELELASDKTKQKKQKLIDEKLKALQDFDREVRDTLRKERDTVAREILKEMDEVIQDYGRKQGYTLILNDRVLIYKDKSLDITEKIIKILNERYKKRKGH